MRVEKLDSELDISILKGSIISDIKGLELGSSRVKFLTSKGIAYVMEARDYMAGTEIIDVCGDVEDLIGSEILQAEEVQSEAVQNMEHITWTFYRITTFKGQVVIRWKGDTTGYYSENVNFRLKDSWEKY